MSVCRLALTPSRAGASVCELTKARAAATAVRVVASSGKEMRSGVTGLPRARTALDSEGGSRISTHQDYVSWALACVEVLAIVTAMSMQLINLVADGTEHGGVGGCHAWGHDRLR